MKDYDRIKSEIIKITIDKLKDRESEIIETYKKCFESIVNEISEDVIKITAEKLPEEYIIAPNNDIIEGYNLIKIGISKAIIVILANKYRTILLDEYNIVL